MEKLKNVIVENKIGSEREQLSEEERESEKSTVERTLAAEGEETEIRPSSSNQNRTEGGPNTLSLPTFVTINLYSFLHIMPNLTCIE